MPLVEGQRLSRDEFLRRWETMPDLKFAELIGGVVYLASPVGLPHSRLTAKVSGLFLQYAAATGGCDVAADATWYLMDDAPQPDVALFVLPEYGGRCRYVDNYIGGPPELVVEISASTVARDFGPRLRLYREAEIQEYVSVVEAESRIVWRTLEAGRYAEVQPTDGVFQSRVFPGLWLDSAALFRNDFPAMIQTLRTGLGSPEHAAFAAGLAPRG